MISSSSFTSRSVVTKAYVAFFAAFTINLWAPLKCGAPGGLNLHVTPSTAVLLSSFCMSNWLTSFYNSPTATTKFVPLSLITSFGTPRRLLKRVKAFRNVSVSSPQAISNCTACVSRQVNRHSHLFLSRFSASLNGIQRTCEIHSCLGEG